LSRAADGLDVTDAASVAQAMGRLEGPFQTVFISVGILAPEGASPEKQLATIDPATMARVFAVNTIGVAQVLSHLPRLLPKRGRSVTGVLSAKVGSIGDNRIGGWHSYRASKAALNQIVHGAGIELARTHREAVIAALHPGTVDTAFTEGYNPGYGKTAPAEAARNLCDVMERLTLHNRAASTTIPVRSFHGEPPCSGAGRPACPTGCPRCARPTATATSS
jgi:NAD(P)-dependent dehydrogenase (short-subunit alcohol dehydrogenase family)